MRSGFILGLCLPANCRRQSILPLLQEISNATEWTEDHLHCSHDRHNEENKHWRGTLVFGILVGLLALVVSTGTVIDTFVDTSDAVTSERSLKPSAERRPLVAFLAEFSAIRTLRRIFTISQTENKGTFAFLNGLRVLSLFWIILGHSFSSGIYYASNIIDMQAARRNIVVHVMTSGAFAVDTFFVVSGFLTTVLFVRQVKRDQLSLRLMAFYYIHRYLRLTPTFILVMLVSVYLTPYFGRGPLYPIQQGFEPDQCRNGNWWSAFLYIGNFLKSDDLCLGITWYLYNDMQFYCIAPLAMIPFAKGRKAIGYLLTIIFVFVSIGSTLGLLLYYPSFTQANTDFVANAVSGLELLSNTPLFNIDCTNILRQSVHGSLVSHWCLCHWDFHWISSYSQGRSLPLQPYYACDRDPACYCLGSYEHLLELQR